MMNNCYVRLICSESFRPVAISPTLGPQLHDAGRTVVMDEARRLSTGSSRRRGIAFARL